MTTKELLFSALILGATAHVTLAMNQDQLNEKFLNAASYGNLKQIEQLLKDGADINAKDEHHGETALHKATSWKYPIWTDNREYIEVISKLIESNIDYDAQDKWGYTAMRRAFENDNHLVFSHMSRKIQEKKAQLVQRNKQIEQIIDLNYQ